MQTSLLICKRCDGHCRLESRDGVGIIACDNPAFVAGLVSDDMCAECTGMLCVACNDTGLESERSGWAGDRPTVSVPLIGDADPEAIPERWSCALTLAVDPDGIFESSHMGQR